MDVVSLLHRPPSHLLLSTKVSGTKGSAGLVPGSSYILWAPVLRSWAGTLTP